MASNDLYQVVFDGTLTGELEQEQVKKNLAAMFKMNATQVEALFSGKSIVIKRNVDEETAKKFSNAFTKAGAKCTLVGGQAAATKPSQPITSESEERATGRMAGKDMLDKKVPTDLGGLTMSEAGETIPTQDVAEDFEIPDLSQLSMSQDESYLVEPTEQPEPDVNISGLSVEDID